MIDRAQILSELSRRLDADSWNVRAVLRVCSCQLDLDSLGLDRARRLRGLVCGQVADLRWLLDDGRSLHAQLLETGHWEFHLDRSSPTSVAWFVRHHRDDVFGVDLLYTFEPRGMVTT